MIYKNSGYFEPDSLLFHLSLDAPIVLPTPKRRLSDSLRNMKSIDLYTINKQRSALLCFFGCLDSNLL